MSKDTETSAEVDEDVLEVDIVFAMFALSISLLLTQWHHWRPSAVLTHGGISMLVGVVLNAGVYVGTAIINGRAQAMTVCTSPSVHDLVYFGLIPPIIFEAGFSMRKRGFFHNITPILLYAVVGTLISTFSAGLLLIGLVRLGLIDDYLSPGISVLFATLISPTDPVATLSVLREVRAPPMLRNCIFGEATLNDALSIVLFSVVRRHYHLFESQLGRMWSSIGHDLLWSIGGSLVTGCGFGLVTALLTRMLHLLRRSIPTATEEVPHIELSLLSTCALLTFTASERLGFSGIMALFLCGVISRHYTIHNLSDDAQAASNILFLTLASLAETSLATLLGEPPDRPQTRRALPTALRHAEHRPHVNSAATTRA